MSRLESEALVPMVFSREATSRVSIVHEYVLCKELSYGIGEFCKDGKGKGAMF